MRALRLVSLPLLVVLAITGCFEQPNESEFTPTDPTAMFRTRSLDSGFMPLSPGNHWRYNRELTTVIIPEDGGPGPQVVEHSYIDVEHVEFREIGEYQYILENEVYSNEPGANQWLLRQDRAGYYSFGRPKDKGKTTGRPVLSSALRNTARHLATRSGADPASVETLLARVDAARRTLRGFDVEPNASPPGGPIPGEIRRLVYPLHAGAEWVLRAGPLFVGTVEAHEQFHGFPAWRVRVDNEFLDENDFVYVWYSRCGQVGSLIHFEGTVTDENGQSLGTLIAHDFVSIAEANIDRGGCDVVVTNGGGNGRGVFSYPMAVGNRWTYEVTTLQRPADGPPVVTTGVADDVQEAWVELEGREYMRQVMRTRGELYVQDVQHYRQDRDGLYVGPTVVLGSRIAGGMPLLTGRLQRPARGPGENELMLLRYPLKVGASWKVVGFGDGQVTATVERRETLALPAGDFDAYRIRITMPLQNPGDEALFWFSREGLLKTYQRAATGGGSWFEETRELLELDLVN